MTTVKRSFLCIYTDAHVVAQQRGVAVIGELRCQCDDEHIVLATHSSLLALILQHYDAAFGGEKIVRIELV